MWSKSIWRPTACNLFINDLCDVTAGNKLYLKTCGQTPVYLKYVQTGSTHGITSLIVIMEYFFLLIHSGTSKLLLSCFFILKMLKKIEECNLVFNFTFTLTREKNNYWTDKKKLHIIITIG